MSTFRQLAGAAQFGLGIVFLLSVLPKLRRPRAFARSVAAYEILPPRTVPLFASMVALLEAFLALAFLSGWANGSALPLAAVLMLGFLSAVGINLNRGRRIPCGCFGARSGSISPRTLARILLLLATVAFVLAIRGATGASVPGLAALVVRRGARGEVLRMIALAGGFLLFGCWLLSLPEIVVVVRGFFREVLPSAKTRDEVEGM